MTTVPQPLSSTALAHLVVRWAEINSGSGHAAGLKRMAAELQTAFGTLPGATAELTPLPGTEATAVRVRINDAAPRRILLSGHYDTVYAADSPFQRCTWLDAGRLRGPGVADMKGGLVVMLAGLRQFHAGHPHPPIGFDVLLTPDEEIGSPCSRALLDTTARSGRFAFALVFEPARANGDLVRTRKGTGVFEITCHGRASHAGRDLKEGRNAILALAEFLHAAAQDLNREPGVSLSVGNFHGGGPVNIVPDLARAEVDVRITRPEHEALVRARLAACAAVINAREGYRLELSGAFNRPPKPLLPLEPALFDVWRRCGQDAGLEFSWQDVGGGSDGNLLAAAGLPTLDGLGPVGDRVHSPHEFVVVETLAERAGLFAAALAVFARDDFQWPLPGAATAPGRG